MTLTCTYTARIGLLVSACAIVATAGAAASEFRPTNYAYAATLAIDGQSALYRAPLRAEIYQHTVRADLADLCVVNGMNEIVPYALSRPPSEQYGARVFTPLPLFPLQGESRTPSDALKFKLQTGDTSVEIEQPTTVAGAIPIGSYLIDARKVNNPVATLRLSWPADTPDFSGKVKVEESADLVSWWPVNNESPVIHLHFNGEEFLRADVPLPTVSKGLLRLSWIGHAPAVALTGISAELRGPRAEVIRQSLRILAQATTQAGEYDFDLGAHPPIDRVSLDLPEANTVIEVDFLARSDKAATWQHVIHGRLYRLTIPDAPELTNTAIGIPVTSARYWKVRVATSGGGLGHGLPTLVAGWLPDNLLFVARGAPPFQLLYGNAAATPLAVPAQSLTQPGGADGATQEPLEAQLASIGPQVELGGESRLTPIPSGIDRKRWILWTVLIVGVGLLSRMAWKLSRSMSPRA